MEAKNTVEIRGFLQLDAFLRKIQGKMPLVLELNAVHRLSIHDPTTDWRADLMGFGADNARAFAKLLN